MTSAPLLVWPLLTGVVLAAASGLRVFLPVTLVGWAARMGWWTPAPAFEWVSSTPSLILLSTATAVEIAAMMIPWVDHAVDALETPAALLAGTLVVAMQLTATAEGLLPGWVEGVLALLVGGGIASGVHLAAAALRVGSTGTTGGLLNPVFTVAETGTSLLLVAGAILLPLTTAAALGLMLFWIARRLRRREPTGAAS
jgi:hypothetical protein